MFVRVYEFHTQMLATTSESEYNGHCLGKHTFLRNEISQAPSQVEHAQKIFNV